MSETRDGLVERLAKRWADECARESHTQYASLAPYKADARWWLLAIAEEIETEGSTSIACNIVAADWLRTEAERR